MTGLGWAFWAVNCRWTTFHNLSLSKLSGWIIVGLPMNRPSGGFGCKSQERFRLRFQRRLREALARQQSAASGFGPAWEQTLEEVPLEEADQAQVYWELIRWAASDELFTAPGADRLLHAVERDRS